MHSAVYLVATVLQFCGWGSPAKSYTEHAHEATALALASPLPIQETVCFFVPEIILWRLAPMRVTLI